MHGCFRVVLLILISSPASAGAATLISAATPDGRAGPSVLVPDDAVKSDHIAVVVNIADPLSRQIGDYYMGRRQIPAINRIEVSFKPGKTVMTVAEFQRIRKEVVEKIPEAVQFLALTWAAPYRVDCMSITTAFAAGFDRSFCAKGCKETRRSPYFNSMTRKPYSKYGWRPTISIAATHFEAAKDLIERGIASDATFPQGTGYLVETTDKQRTVRAALFPGLVETLAPYFDLKHVKTDALEGATDVLLYSTGAARVDKLETLEFRPGALADHLTSAGGKLTDSQQMSSIAWLEAGATGSYGAVIEPCNFTSKFPHPGVLITRYGSGETLIETYWKSVAQPGQGIFIGEPLARPFGGFKIKAGDGIMIIENRSMSRGSYILEVAISPVGPYARFAGPELYDGRSLTFRYRELDRYGHIRLVPAVNTATLR